MTQQRRKYKKQRKVSRIIVSLYILSVLAIILFWQEGIPGANTNYGISTSQAGTYIGSRDRASELIFQNSSEADNLEADFIANHHIQGLPVNLKQIPITEIRDTRYLQLVNRNYSIKSPINTERLISAWPDIQVRATDIKLHESAFNAMRDLYQSAEQNAAIRSLFIASGYRTEQEQRDLYENAADASYVMPPGHSEHQLGLAADILALGSSETGGMRGSDEAAWLAENASEYGLILRYPEHKQHITEVPYEPWHFRYVGHVHAWIMKQHDFVLEEYIDFLQTEEVYHTVFNGMDYYILFQRPENDRIFVPEGLDMSISGSNTGGYIITMWR